jgi:glycerol kinase
MVRAILESIVFRVLQLYQALQKEVKNCYTFIRLVSYCTSKCVCVCVCIQYI